MKRKAALTHFDEGGTARMVDVGDKEITERVAVARASVTMQAATLKLIRDKKAKKGDVLAVAQLAGIMAAKRTAELIPLFHPLPIAAVTLALEVAADAVEITLENRVLTIRGKVDPVRPENLELAYAEYGEGDFERAFTLSEDFDPNRIEAEMRGGVLTLTLPRAPEAQPKKIAVKGA